MLHIAKKDLGEATKRSVRSHVFLVAATVMLSGISFQVYSANECRIEYGYHQGSGFNRQDKVKKIYLNVNQTKTINQSNLNYVKNLKDNKAKFYLSGAQNVTLDRNAVNPPVAFYLTPVKLTRVKCLNQTTQAFNAPEALIQAFKQANKTASQIAQGLKDTFNLGGQQVAQLLKAANYTATQVAKALSDTFNASANQIASWLKAVGYTGAQVVSALKSAINASVQTAASVAKNVLNAAGDQVADWLKAANYVASDVAKGLKSAFNASAQQIASWMKSAGYTGAQVIAALKQGINASAQQAANVAKSVFNFTSRVAVMTMKGAGYGAEQIAASIGSAYNASKKQIAEALEAAGYTTAQIVAALKSGLNASANEVASILKQMGVTRENAERAMRSAGYATSQVAAAIAAAWGETTRQVGKQVGRAVEETGKVIEQTGRVVANPTTAGVAIDCVLPPSQHCRAPTRKNPPEVYLTIPYNANATTLDVYGKNLQGVTDIRGIPGATVEIERKTFGFLRAKVTTRYNGSNWRGATVANARLYANGQAVNGGNFRVHFNLMTKAPVVGPRVVSAARPSSGNTNNTPPNQGGGTNPNRGGTNNPPSALPDLLPVSLMNHWSYGPAVTKHDSRGGSYVYRSVNSSFCATGMTSHTSNSTEGSGLLGSYQRKSFTLPAVIGVNVRNQGSAASSASDVQMKSGNQVVGQTALPSVQTGQQFNVAIPRPGNYNRNKCVIRGGGLSVTGCYACLYDSGEDGELTIVVDSNNSVQESNENNNTNVFR